jgi:hypothetical protein
VIIAQGGAVRLYLDGPGIGEGRVPAAVPLIFSCDETTDLASDTASAVSQRYTPESSVFTGRVRWVEIDLGEDAGDQDHLITPEGRFHIAIARQ